MKKCEGCGECHGRIVKKTGYGSFHPECWGTYKLENNIVTGKSSKPFTVHRVAHGYIVKATATDEKLSFHYRKDKAVRLVIVLNKMSSALKRQARAAQAELT